jgi:hypothetical protein
MSLRTIWKPWKSQLNNKNMCYIASNVILGTPCSLDSFQKNSKCFHDTLKIVLTRFIKKLEHQFKKIQFFETMKNQTFCHMFFGF